MDKMRSQRYDFIRAVAIIFVLFIHSMEILRDEAVKGDLLYSIEVSILSIVEAGVPLFVMLSGALLLGKREPIDVFSRKRATRLIIPFLFWSAVVCCVYCVQNGEGLFPLFFYKYIVGLLTNNIHGIYWFVYMIIGLYILTPIFRAIAQHDDKRMIYVAALFALSSFLLCSFSPQIIEIHKWNFDNSLMVFYYLAGFIVVRDFVRLRNLRRYSIMAFLLCYALLVINCYHCYLKINASVVIIGVSISLFCALISIKEHVAAQLVAVGGGRISRYSYGIYLSHFILISAFVHTKFFHMLPVWIEPFVMVACVLFMEVIFFFIFEKMRLGRFVM